MYKPTLGPDAYIELENGSKNTPVLTLSDGYGGRAQIAVDDGCYVLYMRLETGKYSMSPWWFPEAVSALHSLPENPREAVPPHAVKAVLAGGSECP